MVSYYRNICPNFSSVVAPLSDLLKKNVSGLCSVIKLLTIWSCCLALHLSWLPHALDSLMPVKSGLERYTWYTKDQLVAFPGSSSLTSCNIPLLKRREALALIWVLHFFEVYLTSLFHLFIQFIPFMYFHLFIHHHLSSESSLIPTPAPSSLLHSLHVPCLSRSASTVSDTRSTETKETKEIQKQSLLIHTGKHREARSHTHSTGTFKRITADKGN